MRRKKICVVTTSRADYGLLYWLMREIKDDPDLLLQVVAGGMHMERLFGFTYKVIEKDGFRIDAKVAMRMTGDTEAGMARSVGLGFIGFAAAFKRLKPDFLVILGDRYELLSAAAVALIDKIPVVHIHGGETTRGAVDEAVRHSITKISSVHFASTEAYRRRIIQMGENPSLVFNYGAPGIDSIYRLKLLNRDQLEKLLDFDLSGPVAIATFHPVTLERGTAGGQIGNMLSAIDDFEFKTIFTMANADPSGNVINKAIKKFCARNPKKYRYFKNLGGPAYLSCMKNFDLMIGNSSSGLLEAPSFCMPVVNIGDRQKGRIAADNVINTKASKSSIANGIKLALSDNFGKKIKEIKNPYCRYSDGRISWRIKERLKKIEPGEELLKKEFYDIDINHANSGRAIW